MATIKDKFKSILALLGFASFEATADGIFMQEADLEKINNQLATLEQQVKDKDASIAAEKEKTVAAEKKVTELNTQVTTLTTEKADLQAKLDKKPGSETNSPVNTEDKIQPGAGVTKSNVTTEAEELYARAKARREARDKQS